jgi:hypothetical protein
LRFLAIKPDRHHRLCAANDLTGILGDIPDGCKEIHILFLSKFRKVTEMMRFFLIVEAVLKIFAMVAVKPERKWSILFTGWATDRFPLVIRREEGVPS